jgi:cyclophilin family peptidyl-prolyl cis-trans isomerase
MTMEMGAGGATNDAAITRIDGFIAERSIDKSQPNWKTRLPKPPELVFDKTKKYYWDMDTNHGAIRIELFPSSAPMHVSSTIYLTRLGFYDELAFHRVIPGFMAQGGCPVGRGTGGPGYEYDGEFDPKVKHDRPNLLSMANRGPGTDGSQFFITFVPTPHLNGKHTIFGEVMAGAKTVRELEKRGSNSGQPTEPLKINKASISVE